MPSGVPMKTIKHTNTLVYYDGVQVFAGQDAVGDHHISKFQQQRLAALEPVHVDEATIKATVERDPASKTLNPWERTPTPTQKARWKAIQQARLKGACPCGPSLGNSGSHETPSVSTPTPRSRPPGGSAPRNTPS